MATMTERYIDDEHDVSGFEITLDEMALIACDVDSAFFNASLRIRDPGVSVSNELVALHVKLDKFKDDCCKAVESLESSVKREFWFNRHAGEFNNLIAEAAGFLKKHGIFFRDSFAAWCIPSTDSYDTESDGEENEFEAVLAIEEIICASARQYLEVLKDSGRSTAEIEYVLSCIEKFDRYSHLIDEAAGNFHAKLLYAKDADMLEIIVHDLSDVYYNKMTEAFLDAKGGGCCTEEDFEGVLRTLRTGKKIDEFETLLTDLIEGVYSFVDDVRSFLIEKLRVIGRQVGECQA